VPKKTDRWIRWLIVLGVILAALVAILAFAAWRVERRLVESEDAVIADLEAQLGRPVHIGYFDVDLFPRPTVEVRQVFIGPDPQRPEEAGRAPLRLERGRMRIGVFATLVSFGRRPVIAEVELEGLVVNVVRFEDGTNNWQDIAQRLQGPPDEREPDPRLRATRIADGRVENATVVLIDASGQQPPAKIGNLDVVVQDASLRGPFDGRLSAAVFAPQQNLQLAAHFGRAPEAEGGEDQQLPPLQILEVRSERIELAPLAPFLASMLGETELALERAAVLADLRLELGALVPGGSGTASAEGIVDLRNARFAEGRPFDGRVELDLTADPDRWDLDIRRLLVSVGEMSLESSGKLLDLARAPRFDDFRVRSYQLDFDTLHRHYPGLDDALGIALRGPFDLQADATNGERQGFRARLDLTQASLEVPRRLEKARGVPLLLSAEGEVWDDAVSLDRFVLDASGWRLVANGMIENLRDDAPSFNLAVTTESPDARGLMRLLPEVEEAAGGELALEAELRGTTEAPAGQARLAISQLDVRVSRARFRGGGRAEIDVRPRAGGRTLQLTADFAALEARYRDLVDKPLGTPLRVLATAEQHQDRIESTFEMHVGELDGQGHLTVREREQDRSFDLGVEAAPFALASVVSLVPRMQPEQLPPDLRVGGELGARGVVGRPETLRLHVSSFEAAAGDSDLSGSLVVENLEEPSVEADLRSSHFDVDDFLPPERQPTAERTEPTEPTEPGALDRANGRIDLTVASGRAKIVSYRDLRAELELADGRVHARTLQVSAFGGRFSGAGSNFAPFDRGQPFEAKGEIEGLQVGPMLDEVAGLPDVLQGVASAKIDLSGRGLDREAIEQSLRGTVSTAIDGAVFEPINLISDIRGSLAQEVDIPGLTDLLRSRTRVPAEQPLGDVQARLRFVSGAIELEDPLRASTPYGPLSVRGRIGLDRRLDLQGTLDLTPEAASMLVANEFQLDRSVPVTLQIGGTAESPSVTVANVADTAGVLVEAYLSSELGDRLPEPLRDLPGATDDVRERLEDEGRRRSRQLREGLERELSRP
jgi:hypothetical protein